MLNVIITFAFVVPNIFQHIRTDAEQHRHLSHCIVRVEIIASEFEADKLISSLGLNWYQEGENNIAI